MTHVQLACKINLIIRGGEISSFDVVIVEFLEATIWNMKQIIASPLNFSSIVEILATAKLKIIKVLKINVFWNFKEMLNYALGWKFRENILYHLTNFFNIFSE